MILPQICCSFDLFTDLYSLLKPVDDLDPSGGGAVGHVEVGLSLCLDVLTDQLFFSRLSITPSLPATPTSRSVPGLIPLTRAGRSSLMWASGPSRGLWD